MMSRRPSSTLQLVALFLNVLALAVLTGMGAISSHSRADCLNSSTNANTTSAANNMAGSAMCSPPENISAIFHHYSSYFQSTHIILIQAAVGLALLVFKPALRAMTWTALGVPLALGELRRGTELSSSPSIISAALYVRTLRSMPPAVSFVLFLSILSLLSPLPISAVYRSHTGPRIVSANLTNGGGIGPNLSSSFSTDDVAGGSVVIGRALINSETITGISTPLVSFAPFIRQNSVLGVWATQVETVVARQVLDCGPLAPKRVWNDTSSVVAISPGYFSPGLVPQAEVSFAGQPLGYISDDPHVTVVYINATTAVTPGKVETQSTVIFLAANGTMEGAQERITSTTPLSRIAYIDVLVCTSTARLEISECSIEQGAFKACSPVEAPQLPENASTSPTGGVEVHVKNPISTSIALSASPVVACYQLSNRLPMWNYITEELLASQLPPLSFLSLDIPTAAPYTIPLTYVSTAFFGRTAQALVQGMTTVWPMTIVQPVQLTAVFATSNPILSCAVTLAAAVCAMIAAWGGHMTTRKANELDISTILYMARNGKLKELLEKYAGGEDGLEESVLDIIVKYDCDTHNLSAVEVEAQRRRTTSKTEDDQTELRSKQ